MKYVLLILLGGTGVPTAVFLTARALVYRDTAAPFEASVVGELQVANAEALHRQRTEAAPQQRQPQSAREELTR